MNYTQIFLAPELLERGIISSGILSGQAIDNVWNSVPNQLAVKRTITLYEIGFLTNVEPTRLNLISVKNHVPIPYNFDLCKPAPCIMPFPTGNDSYSVFEIYNTVVGDILNDYTIQLLDSQSNAVISNYALVQQTADLKMYKPVESIVTINNAIGSGKKVSLKIDAYGPSYGAGVSGTYTFNLVH